MSIKSNRVLASYFNRFGATGKDAVDPVPPDLDGSVRFDGTGDFLTVPASSDFDLGSGNFTIEGFFNTSVASGLEAVICSGGYHEPGANGNWIFRISGASGVAVYTFDGEGTMEDGNFSTTIAADTWYHFALVREGTGTDETTCYINGTAIDTCTISKSLGDGGTNGLIIGDEPSGGPGNNPLNGMISNLRILKGTALYTSNFTPPTEPLTAITNTKLLCCQSPTSAIEAAVSPTTIAASGDVTAVYDDPFS